MSVGCGYEKKFSLYFNFQEKNFQAFLEEELSVDGEPVYSLALHLEYLYISRYILLDCRDHLKGFQVCKEGKGVKLHSRDFQEHLTVSVHICLFLSPDQKVRGIKR